MWRFFLNLYPETTVFEETKRLIVKRGEWFQGLPDTAIEKIASRAVTKKIPAGEFIYLVGDTLQHLLCIVAGTVRVSMISAEGQKFLLADLKYDAWFGEPSLLEQKFKVQEARAETEVELLMVPAAIVENVAEEHAQLFKNILYSHLKSTQVIYELLAGMVFYPLKSRLAGRLLDIATRQGKQTSQGIALELNMSQLEIAQLTMGSRQRVNKVLREWVAEGLLIKQGDVYTITDLPTLEAELEEIDR